MNQPIEGLYSEATRSMGHSFIREILKVTKGVEGMISLAGGLPSPQSFPKQKLADLFAKVIVDEGDDVLQYGASDGDALFKNVLKEFEKVPDISNEEIMITVGSTNGIYYFTRTLINPGDIIVCEAPTFPGSISAMEAAGARMVGVPMDDEGMDPDALKAILEELIAKKEPVKFLYVIPEFQNPSGRTMPLERRRDIVRIAKEFDLPIMEDQPYRELRFNGERIITLWDLARTEFNDPHLVTIAKSFSKILGPGLRLGFASGPKEMISQMVKWAQKVNVSPDCTTQRVTARFIELGYMHSHIADIIELYRPRRDAMLEALEKYMPEGVRWTKPDGGMFIWVTFDESMDTEVLFKKALDKKVAFIPGHNFYPTGITRNNELRLNFSYPSVDQIHEGIRRLGELVK